MQSTRTIVRVPGVQGWYPIIAGTRTSVRAIVVLYRDVYPGDLQAVKRSLPHLSEHEIRAALDYSTEHPNIIAEDIASQRAVLAELEDAR